jgi:hypothetical protein
MHRTNRFKRYLMIASLWPNENRKAICLSTTSTYSSIRTYTDIGCGERMCLSTSDAQPLLLWDAGELGHWVKLSLANASHHWR